jgi:hypothetical protein
VGGVTVSDDEIEVREGLIRRIQRHSHAQAAHSWAFERGVIAGRGYWRVSTKVVNEESGDQEVQILRIFNQANVMLDPSHEEPDGSDARWAFVFTDLSWDSFCAEFGEDNETYKTGYGADDWRTLMQDAPAWFKETDGKRAVRVADYYYKTTEGAKPAKGKTPADPGKTVVKWVKLTGCEVLSRTEWAGKYIPIVKVVGEEIQPFDGDRRVEGLIRPARDPQMLFNYMVSAEAETIGLAPRAPFIGYAGQFEGYEKFWEQANTRNLPYLEANAMTEGTPPGTVLPIPQRNAIEPPIQAISQAIQQARQGILNTTGIPEASLGNVDPSLKSGRAIRALQMQAEHGSSNYLDNLARSIAYEGRIINDLLPKIYDRPGRLLKIVNNQNTAEGVMLAPEDGSPMPPGLVPPGQPIPQGAPKPPKVIRLTAGEFDVSVKVGKSFDSRREEAGTSLAEVLTSQPNLFPVYADLWFATQTWPGARQAEKRAKELLPPQIKQAEQQEGLDPQAQVQMLRGELQKNAQMIQALSGELKQRVSQIETDEVKQRADTERTKMEIESRERIAAMNNEASLIETDAKLKSQGAIEILRAQVAELERRQNYMIDQQTLGAQQQHEQSMAEMGQQHDMNLQQQQADLAPEPTGEEV